MELNDEVAQAVFDWYDEKWNVPTLFRKKPVLTLDTSLSTGDHPWARETADDIMKEYFSRFNVDSSNFDFLLYWPIYEGLVSNFIRSRTMRADKYKPKPLTINMLIESASKGRWLY